MKRNEGTFKRLVLSALVILGTVALAAVYLRPDRSSSSRAVGNLKLTQLASVKMASSVGPLGAFVEVSSGIFFIVDSGGRKLSRVDWNLGQEVKWVSLDDRPCSSTHELIDAVYVMKKMPYLLVLYCNRLSVVNKLTLVEERALTGNHGDWLYGLAVSPDENLLTLTSKRKTSNSVSVRVYRTDSWASISSWNAPAINKLEFTPDGKLVATVFVRNQDARALEASECGMTFYDFASGGVTREWIQSVDAGPCPGSNFMFLPDNPERIISGNRREGGAAIWDAKMGPLLHKLPVEGYRVPLWLSLSHDGMLVAADLRWPRTGTGPEYDLMIWDLTRGKAVYQVPAEGDDPILSVRFSPEGNYVVFVRSNRVELYEYTLKE